MSQNAEAGPSSRPYSAPTTNGPSSLLATTPAPLATTTRTSTIGIQKKWKYAKIREDILAGPSPPANKYFLVLTHECKYQFFFFLNRVKLSLLLNHDSEGEGTG